MGVVTKVWKHAFCDKEEKKKTEVDTILASSERMQKLEVIPPLSGWFGALGGACWYHKSLHKANLILKSFFG